MGKRSAFERIERDFYPTPFKPVVALSPHLDDVDGFVEPCIGEGHLAGHLESLGHNCVWGCDIEPGVEAELRFNIDRCAVEEIDGEEPALWIATHFITNPPWPAPRKNGEPTLGIIRHLSAIRPTWLLLSADFKHNVYAAEVLAYCHKVVAVGRVRWIEGSANDGKDNAAWYLFDQNRDYDGTRFYGIGNRRPIFNREIEAMLG